MSRQETRLIVRTPEEDAQIMRKASEEGARRALEEYAEMVGQLRRDLAAQKKLLTRKEVATLFGISTETVTNWGIPRAGKLGNAYVYHLPDVVDYLLAYAKENDDAQEVLEKL